MPIPVLCDIMATFTSICFLNVVVVIVALLYLLLTPSVELEEVRLLFVAPLRVGESDVLCFD